MVPREGGGFESRGVSRCAVIVLQQSTEAFVASNRARRSGATVDQLILKALMIPLGVVVLNELVADAAKRSLAEQDQLVQALALDGQYESLSVCVQVWRAAGELHGLDAAALGDSKELRGVLGVAIMDQVSLVAKEAVFAVDEIAGHLRHEGSVGIWSDISILRVDSSIMKST